MAVANTVASVAGIWFGARLTRPPDFFREPRSIPCYTGEPEPLSHPEFAAFRQIDAPIPPFSVPSNHGMPG